MAKKKIVLLVFYTIFILSFSEWLLYYIYALSFWNIYWIPIADGFVRFTYAVLSTAIFLIVLSASICTIKDEC